MNTQRITVELESETLSRLAVFGRPADVLQRLAELAASDRRHDPSSIEDLFADRPPSSLRLLEDEALIADQREANEHMVRSTIRAQDLAAEAVEHKERAEDRERELRAVSEFREMFIGILGHDLRNPVNGVVTAAAALLRRGHLDVPDAETAARIIRSGQRITRMISQLLDLTRARLGGGLPIEPTPTDLRNVCQNVVDEFETPVILTVHGDATGIWDSDRLAEVLSNLTGNALEYAAPGTRVLVDVRDEGADVTVAISNQGEAIPADVLPFIFQPFRRGRPRAKSVVGNLGLGLYIADQIIQSHGGTLQASSAGGTTTFVMRLPRTVSPVAAGEEGSRVTPVLLDIDAVSRQAVLDGEARLRAQAEAAQRLDARVREGDARYRRLFEAIDEGFCVLEKVAGGEGAPLDFRYIEANAAFAVHAGVAGIIGRTIRETVPGESEDWFRTYDDVCRTGNPTRFERTLAATGRALEVYAFRVEDASHRRLAVLFKDITGRKLLERAAEERLSHLAELDRRKSEFLGTLGHELRNPLSTLAHCIALLTKLPEDGPASADLLRSMGRQTARMGLLLDQILVVARVTSGAVELTMGRVDLAEVVRGAVETVRHLMECQRHRLTVLVPPEGVWVMGDALRLIQAVENLLANAAKCTSEGGEIELSLEVSDDEARITVRDNGQGMSAELLPHIFELFIQEPQTLDRPRGGLGLGLPLVQRLVQMHHGQVSASSPGPGLGSELVVKLPRLRDGEGSPTDSTPPSRAAKATAVGRRILVVDDEREMAEMFAYLLAAEGHQTETVSDGWSTLEAARTFDPEVVILDLGLPGMDGYEVARRLREEHGRGHFLLIAVTGYQNDARRLDEAGFDRHLTKPPDMKKLFAFIAAWPGRP